MIPFEEFCVQLLQRGLFFQVFSLGFPGRLNK